MFDVSKGAGYAGESQSLLEVVSKEDLSECSRILTEMMDRSLLGAWLLIFHINAFPFLTLYISFVVLYSVLICFTIFGLMAAGYFRFLPDTPVTKCLTLHKNPETGEADYFLSARNSAGTWSIALSFFASGMGAWILYGTTEMGANPAISWLGVIGYSFASGFPALVICVIGPKVREQSSKSFSTTDFSLQRYGRVMQLTTAAVSVFYMFIYIVAELTSSKLIPGSLQEIVMRSRLQLFL